MRLPLIAIIPVLIFGILVDWYICRAVRKRCPGKKPYHRFAMVSSLAFNILLVVAIAAPKRGGSEDALLSVMWILYLYFCIYIPKAVFCLIDLLGKLPRLWGGSKLRGFCRAGIIGAVIACVLMVSGIFNRNRIQVREVDFEDSRVPYAFDGFTIAQISDLHVGSFGSDTSFVSKLVDKVNSLNPDLIVFTGDIVNRRTAELEPFVYTLKRLKAPMGVISILGNHDHGDYYQWMTRHAKENNIIRLRGLNSWGMRWHLLENDSKTLRIGNDSIVVIGVDNIGDPPFHCYGDLDKAYPGDLADPTFKILLSHNPAHWTNDIKDAPDKNIPLTLSGHTHAMQMELLGISPASWRYDTWGGMYAGADSSHRLYVNIGAGEVAIPARIGATPEITYITLRKAE